MSVIRVPTNFNIELEFESADFGRRMIAWLIDFVLKAIYVIICFYILKGMVYSVESNIFYLWKILYAPILFYDLLFETFTNGRSPGKLIMKIKVIREDGGRPSFGQYVIRWLMRTADFGTFGLGAIFSYAFSKYGQRLGDLAAGTLVISTKYEASIEDTLFVEVADTYVPVYTQVMRLSDRDINTIKRVLDKSLKDANSDLLFRTSEKVAKALKIDHNTRPREFLTTLIKDYNYLSVK